MSVFNNFFQLFYPKLCAICDTQLIENEKTLCTFCRHDLPLMNISNYKDNKIIKAFYGRIPIVKATSFLFYRKEGKAKTLIHQLKYKGNQKIGIFLGNWFGNLLKDSNEFSDVDYIVPVPLHPKKEKERGYNQLTTFGKKLSEILAIPYQETILIRTTLSKTQTFKQRFERFKNTSTKFAITDNTYFIAKHILLIDDVITTGATLEACCNELLKTPKVKISIVTMAFTQ